MLSVMWNELVTDATPPVVNAGPNAGLMAMPYVCVSVPRSTNRDSSFAAQPPPSPGSPAAPGPAGPCGGKARPARQKRSGLQRARKNGRVGEAIECVVILDGSPGEA